MGLDKSYKGGSYRTQFGVSTKDYEQQIDTLVKEGYLTPTLGVEADWRIPALFYMLDNHNEWEAAFKDINVWQQSASSKYLVEVVHHVHRNDFEAARKVRRPYEGLGQNLFDLGKYVKKLAMGDARYLTLLTADEIPDAVSGLLYDLYCREELDKPALVCVRNMIPKKHYAMQEMLDEIAAYHYFLTGDASIVSNRGTQWSYAVRALVAAYQKDYVDAIELFDKALTAQKSKKWVFRCPLLNFFYALTLLCAKRNSTNIDMDNLKKRINSLRYSSEITFDNENFMTCTLLCYQDNYGDYVHNDIKKRLTDFLSKERRPLYKSFAKTLCQHFGIEMSDLGLDCGPVENFGGNPLIESCRRDEPWEQVLKQVQTKVSSDNLKFEEVQESPKRIAWFVRGYRLDNIIEQTLSDDGKWINSQHLNLPTMKVNMFESMDKADIALVNDLLNKKSNVTDVDAIIPRLADTGRLFYGTEFMYKPVEITEENPYIEASGKGQEIYLDSNVKQSSFFIDKHSIYSIGNGRYRVVKVNALQKDILERLLKQRSFPISAIISLKKTLESLKGVIEVKDNLSVTLGNEATFSKGKLAVRITPQKTEYKVMILSTGMENGSFRGVPGQGEQRLYDDVDGLSFYVERDIDKEKENFYQLKMYLEEKMETDFTRYNEALLISVEQLLELLLLLQKNQDRYFAEWPEGVRIKLKGEITAGDIDVQVKTEQEWFRIEGKVHVGSRTWILAEMLEKYCNSGKSDYIRVDDDEFLHLSDQIRKYLTDLANLPSRPGKIKQVPKYMVGTLAKTLEGLRAHTDDAYTKQLEKMKSALTLDPEIPTDIKANMRPYQKVGYTWMKRLDAWGAGFCLADDMGLGKTLQALAFLVSKASEGASLVVAPKSVVPNWVKEAGKFAPYMHMVVLNNESNRAKCLESMGPGDLILCTYGILASQSALLLKKEWNVACLDEAHQIKNRQTRMSQVAMQLKAKTRMILTGTPMQNHIGELWNLFQFINPGLLGPWQSFKAENTLPTPDDEHMMVLKEMTQPFILRRTKEEVLDELPGKEVMVEKVEMSQEERTVYEEMRRLAEIKFKKNKTKAEKQEAKDIITTYFTELSKLRMAACSMRLVFPDWSGPSSKINALMDMLDDIMVDSNNCCVVFSQFTSFLSLIRTELKKRNIEYVYMDGSTELEKRQDVVDVFQSGQCNLFLSSLKAGGLGINLTAANYVILLDPWWNPAIENQAMDRAHRLGQTRNVTVIRLVCEQTIEEKILRLHEAKQSLSDEILEDTGLSYKLTYEDIMDMVAPF